MFKIGDKVRIRDNPSNRAYSEMWFDGKMDGFIIDQVSGETCRFKDHWFGIYKERLELEETHFPLYSEEAAVKLLTERGYEVKAPPEPLNGKVYIYQDPDGCLYHRKEGWTDIQKGSCELLAIVDWTEGQGI